MASSVNNTAEISFLNTALQELTLLKKTCDNDVPVKTLQQQETAKNDLYLFEKESDDGKSETSMFSQESSKASERKDHRKIPELWEADLIGNFLLFLYHQRIIEMGSRYFHPAPKHVIYQQFNNFINADSRKRLMNANNNNIDIGNLLARNGFLISKKSTKLFYMLHTSKITQFSRETRHFLDQQRILNKNVKKQEDYENMKENPLEIVDENASINKLIYEGTIVQTSKKQFQETNLSCCICQENFTTIVDFEDHVEKHSTASNFELAEQLIKLEISTFEISYCQCRNSHKFCFIIKSKPNEIIVIEKIIIVQMRDFLDINSLTLPKEMHRTDIKFFIDSQALELDTEIPIVIICHIKNSPNNRIIEQHHFMRSESLPTVSFDYSAYNLPSTKDTLKLKKQRFVKFPSKKIMKALENITLFNDNLVSIVPKYKEYIDAGRILKLSNYYQVLTLLTEIEDIDTTNQFKVLIEKNVTLRSYGDDYSLRLKTPSVFVENILGKFDTIILIEKSFEYNINPETIIMNYIDEDIIPHYEGQITNISFNKVCFKSEKMVPIRERGKLIKYLVIFRPQRLIFNMRYRTLELISSEMNKVKKFLFPNNLESMPLPTQAIDLFNKSINNNPEQLQTVRNIAQGPRNDAIYIIFGPPGTGKTSTIVESIMQLLGRPNTKILVTAHSNTACDEVALRLIKVMKQYKFNSHNYFLLRLYAKSCDNRKDDISEELIIHSNLFDSHFYPSIETLQQYRILICTLTVVANMVEHKLNAIYSHIFIDEVAACSEVEALMGFAKLVNDQTAIIIAGDHKQLGPVMKSKRAEQLGLGVSLMERLIERPCYKVDPDTGEYDRTIQTRLRYNFRSHPEILMLYNSLYYDHTLYSKTKIENIHWASKWHRLANINYPIIFHAVKGSSMKTKYSVSLYNYEELCVVLDYVKELMYFGINGKKILESDIGIISPYKKQYTAIKEKLNLRRWFNIEVGSVEMFQGKEKPIIIVSFVRSGTSNLGFLNSARRLNVTISRAKSLLILIGNPITLSMNKDFEYIINVCQSSHSLRGLDDKIYRNNNEKTFGIMLEDLNSMELQQLIRQPNFNSRKKRSRTFKKEIRKNVSKIQTNDEKTVLENNCKKMDVSKDNHKKKINSNTSKKTKSNTSTITNLEEIFEDLPKIPGHNNLSNSNNNFNIMNSTTTIVTSTIPVATHSNVKPIPPVNLSTTYVITTAVITTSSNINTTTTTTTTNTLITSSKRYSENQQNYNKQKIITNVQPKHILPSKNNLLNPNILNIKQHQATLSLNSYGNVSNVLTNHQTHNILHSPLHVNHSRHNTTFGPGNDRLIVMSKPPNKPIHEHLPTNSYSFSKTTNNDFQVVKTCALERIKNESDKTTNVTSIICSTYTNSYVNKNSIATTANYKNNSVPTTMSISISSNTTTDTEININSDNTNTTSQNSKLPIARVPPYTVANNTFLTSSSPSFSSNINVSTSTNTNVNRTSFCRTQ